MLQPQLVQPRDEPVQPVLGDRQLGERPAEHDRDPVLAITRELGLQVPGGHGGPPSELDEVDVVAGHLHQPVDLGDRQAAVEHMSDALLAGLRGALG